MMKVTLAQLNPTIGDIAGNVAGMGAAAQRAAAEGAGLVVFAELSLTGYYPADLLNEPGFMNRVEQGLEALRSASRELPGLHWVVGAPVPHGGPGKPLHNALLVLHNGEVVLRYAKQLLPTYGVFDERRHFEPGPDVARVLRIGGMQVGLLVCEDGWNDHGRDYAVNPFERLHDAARCRKWPRRACPPRRSTARRSCWACATMRGAAASVRRWWVRPAASTALTLALAAEALGPQNVVAVTMPSRHSSRGSVDDSVALCRNLGVVLHTHPIADLVSGHARQFEHSFGPPLQGLPLENLQARIRGTVLMEYSNHFGPLLLTTGNKSEISVGYCTLYGDTNGGLGLIGDLYKTEVFELSRHLNQAAGRELIPQAILDKEPSAELAPGQKDSDSLPPYAVLDPILKVLIEGSGLAAWELDAAHAAVDALRANPAGRALVERVRGLIARNEYKRRQAPPIIRVRGRAFGSGRQMPIAALHG